MNNNNNTASQRNKILSWFHHNKSRLSTLEAREILGIMSPAARIMELRRSGYVIHSYWISQIDVSGQKHRLGQYIYMGKHAHNKKNEHRSLLLQGESSAANY